MRAFCGGILGTYPQVTARSLGATMHSGRCLQQLTDNKIMSTQFSGAEEKTSSLYFTVLGSDGTLRTKAQEGEEGAVRREWETKDGTKGVKWERVFGKIEGMITNVGIFEGDYGTNLVITISDKNGMEAKLSLGLNTPFGEDVAKKLPNVDFEEPVSFAPYAFVDDRGKDKKGVTVMQGENKLQSFFNGYDVDAKKFTYANGYPEPKGDTSKYNSDKWKVYFGECRIFLQEYVEKYILPRFEGVSRVVPVAGNTDGVDPSDIAF